MTGSAPSADDSFTCANCGGTWKKAWSDEEAEAEALDVFGAPIDEPVYLCDDCYEKIQAWGERAGELDRERSRLESGRSDPPVD